MKIIFIRVAGFTIGVALVAGLLALLLLASRSVCAADYETYQLPEVPKAPAAPSVSDAPITSWQGPPSAFPPVSAGLPPLGTRHCRVVRLCNPAGACVWGRSCQ